MAWERRRKGKYYYRSRRVNGRVVKEYVGSGPEAEEAARRDEEARRAAAEKDARWREFLRQVAETEAALDRLDEVADLVADALMLAAGYHRTNRGPWRKRRTPKPKAPSDSAGQTGETAQQAKPPNGMPAPPNPDPPPAGLPAGR